VLALSSAATADIIGIGINCGLVAVVLALIFWTQRDKEGRNWQFGVFVFFLGAIWIAVWSAIIIAGFNGT
jgi:hypothetical protein